MGAVVTVAGVDQHCERMDHVLKTLDLFFQFVDVALRQALVVLRQASGMKASVTA